MTEKPSKPAPEAAVSQHRKFALQLTPEQHEALGKIIRELALDPGVQETFRSIGRGIQQLVAKIPPLAMFIGKTLLGVAEIMAKLPEQLQRVVLALASRGWFFDHEADLAGYWRAEALIRDGDAVGADALMASHFASRCDAIEDALCVRLPHRAKKIRNAFGAHRRGEFDLSILALLAQADGVCKELRGGHFFLMDRLTRKPEAAAYATANSNNVFNEVLHMALVEHIPLKQQMSKRGQVEGHILNRHAVMHGESLDYDTEENSLRAISLLNYVALSLDPQDPERVTSAANVIVRSTVSAMPVIPTAR
jgi:hypothetical protein